MLTPTHKINFTNQVFCYWLQGYFEIEGATAVLDAAKIALIKSMLQMIVEPLGVYTMWLSETLFALEQNQYPPALVKAMTGIIKKELNGIFLHVIDPSYDTPHTHEHLLAVHRGERDDK